MASEARTVDRTDEEDSSSSSQDNQALFEGKGLSTLVFSSNNDASTTPATRSESDHVVTETESVEEPEVGKAWEVVALHARAQASSVKDLGAKVAAVEAALDDVAKESEVRALRGEESVDAAKRHFAASLEAALDSERAARTALARRVAELTRDFAEARARDTRRIADLEAQLQDNKRNSFGEASSSSSHHKHTKWDKWERKKSFDNHRRDENDEEVVDANVEALRELEDQILVLCDQSASGSVLCANLPRLYYYHFRKALDFRGLGFVKMSQLLSKMTRLHFDGKHRAEVSRRPAPLTTTTTTRAPVTTTHAPVTTTHAVTPPGLDSPRGYFPPNDLSGGDTFPPGVDSTPVVVVKHGQPPVKILTKKSDALAAPTNDAPRSSEQDDDDDDLAVDNARSWSAIVAGNAAAA